MPYKIHGLNCVDRIYYTFGVRRKNIFPALNYGIFSYVVGDEEESTYHPFPARLVLKDVLLLWESDNKLHDPERRSV